MSNVFYLYPILRNDAGNPNDPNDYVSIDYPESNFIIESDLTFTKVNGQKIGTLSLKGSLNQPNLLGHIHSQRAACVIHILCQDTFLSRERTIALDAEGKFAVQIDDLDAGLLKNQLTIQASVIASSQFELAKPTHPTYSIEVGQILGISNEIEYFVDEMARRPLSSLFRIRINPIPQSPWKIEFQDEVPYANIFLYVSEVAKNTINKVTATKDAKIITILENAIVIPALQVAILQMRQLEDTTRPNYLALEQQIVTVGERAFLIRRDPNTPITTTEVGRSLEIAQKIVAQHYKNTIPLDTMLIGMED